MSNDDVEDTSNDDVWRYYYDYVNWVWWPQDGHYPNALTTDKAMPTARICFGPRNDPKAQEGSLTQSLRCPYLCLMFHDMMCDTTPSILTPRLLLRRNQTRMFFILSFIDMNVTLTLTLKNRHTMADILSALTLLGCDYWLKCNQRWLMTSQQEIMGTLSVR